MNTLPKYYRFILFFILVIVSIQLDAQVNSVNKYLADVDRKVEQINQLANNKQVYQAITLLNETRRDLDSYVNNYLEDEMRKAKAENPSFGPFLNVQFSSVLTAAYWEERVEKAQKSIDLAKEAMADSHHNRTLDSQDEAWSYLKTVYGIGKTIKDVADNVSTAQFYDAVKSAQEGVDGFIENYKEIENARLQIINTQLYETTINGLIRRGEIMEEKAWQFSSFMRTYEQDVNDFYQIVGRLNQKIDQIKREEAINWNSADYSWNKQTYLNQINAIAQQFKQGNFDYSTLKEKIEAINEQAENDKIGIYQNIQNSGANDAFERGNQLEEDFNEFYDLSIDVLDECYRFDQNREKAVTQTISTQNIANNPQNNNVNSNSDSETVSIPANSVFAQNAKGKRIPNKLYHSYWDIGGWRILLKQTGNSVEIEGVGIGTISGGNLICKYKDKKGEDRTDVYTLIEDGYKMEVKKEWTDDMITSDFLLKNNFTAPSEQQIKEFRAKNGNFKTYVFNYKGGTMAMYEDSDQDQVPDKCDNCSNTVPGLTVQNGGVDIAGCPTGQGETIASEPVSQPANNSYPSQSQSNQSKAPTTTNNTNQKATTSAPVNTSKNTQSVKAEPAKIEKSWATKDLRQGFSSTAIIPISELKKYDKLVFKHISGQFVYLDVYWNGISAENVIYKETKQTIFSTADLLSKIPNNANRINVIVNRFKNIECTLQGWTLPAGVAIPSDWSIVGENKNVTGGGSGGSNNSENDFYELISKADEAFNKKYWTESGGAQATSNPKQESFDYLRKAQPLIAQQQDVTQRYSMVLTLASKYAEYAKRVFANAAKNDFIQTAGSLLGQYGGAATSVKDAKAKAYNNIADGWRELTKAAMWGGHQYNKAACDVEAKKYYDLALREDRNNVQLQKTVEKINAPKKAVPAAVAATKPIPESSWAKAENLRNMIVENTPIQLDDEPHYSEIGQMKIDMGSINVGSGKVWLLRSGAKDWELVSKSGEYIFVGDKIKTSDDATNISFDYSEDKAHLVIKSGSVVTFYLDQIYIERGDTEIYVQKRGKEFLVITPKAVTGCRGTEFSVKVDDSGTTDVHLFEGIVEMRNSTEISYLVPGQTAKVEKDDETINVVQFNIQQHKQQYISNQNQLNTTNQSNPFQNVTGGGRVVGGQ